MSPDMSYSIDPDAMARVVYSQLQHLFPEPSLKDNDVDAIVSATRGAYTRIAYAFQHIQLAQYRTPSGAPYFNHLHGDHYAMFLYLLANELYQMGSPRDICDRVFNLNKFFHGIDAYYEIELPNIFIFVHPLGTVLGRGTYGDYFAVYQRCGIGSNHGKSPHLGQYVTMHPGSSVLGDCRIGNRCELGAGTLLLDTHCPDDHLIVGTPGANRFISREIISPIWGKE